MKNLLYALGTIAILSWFQVQSYILEDHAPFLWQDAQKCDDSGMITFLETNHS